MRDHGKPCLWLVGSGLRPCLGRCGLGCASLPNNMRAWDNPCLWPLGSDVSPCLGPVWSGVIPCAGLECEFLLRTLRARVWFLVHGPYMCVCESLPSHWGLGCETLSRTCRLGCESLPRTMQPCVWDLAYDPVYSSVSPCLRHLLRTPAEAVVNNIYHWHI